MSFFDFFKHNKKEDNQPTVQRLANRYLVESDDYWIPLGRPKRNYKITDMTDNKEFELNIIYDVFDVADLEKTQAEYYDFKDNYYEVTVTVKSADNIDDKPSSFSSRLNQKDEDKIIGFKDVDLALYNQLKEARANAANPQRQEEAYLVSTLLRAAHDYIWIAPLLMQKSRWERTTPELEKIKTEINAAQHRVQNKVQNYKQRREEENELFSLFPQKKQKKENPKFSAEQIQQKKSEYIKSLMKENLVDGI